ncbi:hypothetical protein [Brumimicrobium oceani]|uniref:DUF2269 domain-containing protein n=1 Tax=Brumimicrobium oceani TaxID=2100725 RepID=A0A2U2XAG6_9FLAO|nr:hypothetical protein [Brumimicrobium oceani]PWH84789.1 hypothetical protein DIT68_12725 [Brumimicrobium oceani]
MRDLMLILHFIGLAMGLGTAFAHAFLGFASSKLSKEEAGKLRKNTHILGSMGTIGLVLLFVSGVYLILPYWNALLMLPLLLAKLILFVLLIVFLSIIKFLENKAMKSVNPDPYLKKLEIIGKFSLLTSTTIVVLAVLVFH